ncbi:site-specific integrase [Halopenitus salinus]|uniref:Site-specific integrase n=1 Tax=Halopenitus salinus TaxID=1198295 RepID=A0ABD5URF7_9EURY
MTAHDRKPSATDALGVDTYFRMYIGALRIDDRARRLITCYVILLAGRLGMRLQEIQHLRESWIDWKRGEICIPSFDPCGCSRCWVGALDVWGRKGLKELQESGEWESGVSWKNLKAEQREDVIKRAEFCTPENLQKIVYTSKWSPKYDRSARVIAFGWSYRITACLVTFFDEFDCLDWQQHSINRLLKEAAENADGVDSSEISAHPLRATGETFLADASVDVKMLRDLAGWEDLQTARYYIAKSGRINTLKLYNVMGKGDEAPPVVPEDPEHQFPVIGNPFPFQNEPFSPVSPDGDAYDEDVRRDRHREQQNQPLPLHHPRDVNLPYDRAGFPDKDQIHYDPNDHELPGHIDRDSDRVETKDGVPVTEATTLVDVENPHRVPRSRDPEPGKHRADWVNSKLDEFLDQDSDDNPALSVVGLGGATAYGTFRSASTIRTRLSREWNKYWMTNGGAAPNATKFGKGVAMYVLLIVLPLAVNFGFIFEF